MNLSKLFILRPIMTTLTMVAILIVGIISYFKLPVSNMPDVSYPFISVTVLYPGASPETMANNVATPLEREFLTISGLISVNSNNTLGNSLIILQFDMNKNIDSASVDVQAAITRATPNLPPDLPSAPTYMKVNPSQNPIAYYNLYSETMTDGDMYDYANSFIGQRFALVEGVAEIQIFGSPRAIRVQVEPAMMSSLGITLDDVSKAIIHANPYLPLGGLDGPDISSYIIATNGQLVHAEEYDPVIVRYKNQSPVRIQDIGKTIDSTRDYKEHRIFFKNNVEVPAITIAVKPQPGANVVNIVNDIDKMLPSIMKQLPPSLKLNKFFDLSEPIKASVYDVQITLIIAFILVVLVIFLYLGNIAETVIPIIVLPMSVIGTFIIMWALNYTIDNLSLMALILAVGFVIDDAIVVIENIVRRVEVGESPWEAALEGSKQIGFTILSMTLSLVAVFIPILFMAGLLGKVLAEFAVTLTTITLISGFISLTLTPMLCSIFISSREKLKKQEVVHIGHRFNDFMLSYYEPSLKWILKNRWVAIVVFIVSTILSGYLFVVLPKDLMPNDDVGFILAYTQTGQGTSSERTKELQYEVLQLLEKSKEVKQIISVSPFLGYRNGIIPIILKPREERRPIMQVISDFSKETAKVIGINVFYKNFPLLDLSVGFQIKGAFQYTMQSLDPNVLYPAAKEFEYRMLQMPELQGVNSDLEVDTPQLNFNILRDKAHTLGITAENIEKAMELAYSAGRISRINTPINQYDVILELNPKLQEYPSTLDLIYLRSDTTNQMVPLRAVADWNMGIGPNSVNHTNQFPSVTISFNLASGVSLGDILNKLDKLAEEVLPTSVTGKVVGAAEVFQQSFLSAALLIPVTIFVIYIVLGILYESFIHPLTILTTLPPATLGGLLMLYVTGNPLALYSFLGIIMLIGIVKKNGIMMVDFALDNIREKGESPEKSIYEACIVRFRPIMMTTLTAIMGALPIALGAGAGAEGRRPLGLVIIGGLLLSQLITLYITPVLYLYLEKFHEKLAIQSRK